MIGRTIGKYRIVGQLGRGGMGTVYKAVDATLDREVAIKILNPDLTDSQIMERFRAEATTLAKLNHPEIATIYELFQAETDLFIVMEFVRGETLERISDRLGALPPERAAYLIDKILDALEHAHRAGIVHCDIKPANVMITERGGVKIMDFGTARVRGAEHASADGYMMGTPAYMSPEQVLGRQLDGRSDLYSVGVVFYRLLAGSLPFHADTATAMVQKQISEAPAPLHVHREGLPGWCDAILQRALEKAPADRFQTAEEFRDTLGRATGRVTIQLAKAFSISVADGEASAPPPAAALEHFAPTPVLGLARTAVLADGASHRGQTRRSGLTPSRLKKLLLVLVAAAVAAVGVARLWRPRVARTADASPARTAPAPTVEAVTIEEPVKPPVEVVDEPEEAAPRTVSAPLVFEAKTLVRDGGRQRETRCRVVLANGTIAIKASDNRRLLHEVANDQVLSISYSQGVDPLWNTPTGPKRVTSAPGGTLGFLGIFVARDWVTLRTTNAKAQFVVLRFDDGAHARRAITALEKRTGRAAERVAQGQP